MNGTMTQLLDSRIILIHDDATRVLEQGVEVSFDLVPVGKGEFLAVKSKR